MQQLVYSETRAHVFTLCNKVKKADASLLS